MNNSIGTTNKEGIASKPSDKLGSVLGDLMEVYTEVIMCRRNISKNIGTDKS
jgi:hypothetical protein